MTAPTSAISHDEAKEIALRLIAGAFHREDKRPQFSIPANPDRDDDLRMIDYINQQAALAAQVGECKTCGGRGYVVEDAEYEPVAVRCPDCKAANLRDAQVKLYVLMAHATIERCAQVAEAYHAPGQGTLLMYLAAAIRKLKDDKPIDPNIVYPGKDLTNVFPEETE